MDIVNKMKNVPSKKRLRTGAGQTIVLSEWFLSILLDYLNMREIVTLDSAICNKFDRGKWLECIAKDMGSTSTKIQRYLNNDEHMKWCYKKNVQFRYLLIDHSIRPCSITSNGASIFSMCCINLLGLELRDNLNEISFHNVISSLGQKSSKLKIFTISKSSITDNDMASLMSCNHELEDIELSGCPLLTDASLTTIADSCTKLRRIRLMSMHQFSDQGITALVSTNHVLEEIWLSNCTLLTGASLIAIAENCRKLINVTLYNLELITDQEFMALVSSNHDLEDIRLMNCPLLTGACLRGLAAYCHKLRIIDFQNMNQISDKDITFLLSANPDLKAIYLDNCTSLTEASLITIADNCHKLVSISISGINQISDQTISAIISKFHNLKEYFFKGCTLLRVTTNSLITITNNILLVASFLRTYCIMDIEIIDVVSKNQDLEDIFLYGCPGLSQASLTAIADNCPKLKKLFYHKSFNSLSESEFDLFRSKRPGVELLSDE